LGLILDTSILIANERRRGSIEELLVLADAIGETELGISSVSVVELTHGIYRARTEAEKERRRRYTEKAFRDLGIHTVTVEIAQLAGKIEGEQAAKGIAIGFEDLVIGATALYLGYDVATHNIKHFKLIPGLRIVSL
jgi:tRNA(fMet)-specific endonuclease VapC